MTASSFAAALSEAAAVTEALLERLLAATPGAGEIARPARLIEAMRYAVLGGGKRLRPFLAVGRPPLRATGAGLSAPPSRWS